MLPPAPDNHEDVALHRPDMDFGILSMRGVWAGAAKRSDQQDSAFRHCVPALAAGFGHRRDFFLYSG